MALGPILGGSLISLYGEIEGMRIAFIAALILAGVSLVLLQLFIDAPREDRKAVTRQSGISGLKLLHPSLRNLLVSDIMVRFCEQIPYAFVVLWCVSINRITPFEFGILTAIEMITSALVYLPVAYFADKGTKKPFVVITFGFFTLFPIVLLMAESFWVLVIAFIIRGLKEFGEPTRKALIMDLAPEGRKATTFGIYYLVRDLFVSVAAFAGALLWDPSTMSWIVDAFHAGYFLLPLFDLIASPATNLLTAFAFGLAGTLYFLVWGRDVHVAPPIHEEGKNG